MTTAEEVKIFLGLISPSLGNLTYGSMPESESPVGTVYAYGGRQPEKKFGQTGIGFDTPTLQVVFRGVPYDFSGPWEKARVAQAAFMAVTPGPLCVGVSTDYMWIKPLQPPFTIRPMDERKRIYVGFNIQIQTNH